MKLREKLFFVSLCLIWIFGTLFIVTSDTEANHGPRRSTVHVTDLADLNPMVVNPRGSASSVNSQGNTLNNSSTTGAANTAVVVTLTAVPSSRHYIRRVLAYCSGGTGSLTITDGGVTIYNPPTTIITTSVFREDWDTPLTGAVNSEVVITLGTCGVSNTGTLIIQADRF